MILPGLESFGVFIYLLYLKQLSYFRERTLIPLETFSDHSKTEDFNCIENVAAFALKISLMYGPKFLFYQSYDIISFRISIMCLTCLPLFQCHKIRKLDDDDDDDDDDVGGDDDDDDDDDDGDEVFLWTGWSTKDLYALFPDGTFVRDCHHLWRAASKIWSCTESKFRLYWMRLSCRNNHYALELKLKILHLS